ncbi:MAG: YegS/Rv2252/BmrU family lipid kinase [Clostridia bacterium]|nr:YegS/Rv2252/BmrU family lipid kinase [Clostridia bacterium]
MKHIFFINPTAGKGNLQERIIKSIKKYFVNRLNDFEIYITKCKGDAEIVAKKIAKTKEEVCIYACGGEGTFYEILNGVVGFDNVSLGVIPCGSANDFLKYFNSKETFFDISSQIDGEKVAMDIIKAGDRYCFNGCSVGMDAIVARDMSLFKNWPLVSGKMSYKLAIAKSFLSKIGIKIKLSIDDKIPQVKTCLFAVIANGPFYGGGYMAAPKAVPNDGKLNFTMVDIISKLRVPSFLKKYEKGDIFDLDYCSLCDCSSMSFDSDTPIPVNLDGEIIETKSMRFEIVKSAVKFIIPKGVKAKLLTNF